MKQGLTKFPRLAINPFRSSRRPNICGPLPQPFLSWALKIPSGISFLMTSYSHCDYFLRNNEPIGWLKFCAMLWISGGVNPQIVFLKWGLKCAWTGWLLSCRFQMTNVFKIQIFKLNILLFNNRDLYFYCLSMFLLFLFKNQLLISF